MTDAVKLRTPKIHRLLVWLHQCLFLKFVLLLFHFLKEWLRVMRHALHHPECTDSSRLSIAIISTVLAAQWKPRLIFDVFLWPRKFVEHENEQHSLRQYIFYFFQKELPLASLVLKKSLHAELFCR